MVRAEVDADVGDVEVGALANPTADLQQTEAEGIELEAWGPG